MGDKTPEELLAVLEAVYPSCKGVAEAAGVGPGPMARILAILCANLSDDSGIDRVDMARVMFGAPGEGHCVVTFEECFVADPEHDCATAPNSPSRPVSSVLQHASRLLGSLGSWQR